MFSKSVGGAKNSTGLQQLGFIVRIKGALMDLIKDFDPWKDPLCTCPPKYGFNPYTGCSHACVYCYITSYIPNAFQCRPKVQLLKRVKRDLLKIDLRKPISMSNSSDPYPPEEKELLLTRRCLELFQERKCKVLLITKSNLVLRDLDLLERFRCAVSFTITTLQPRIYKKLEPAAPKPELRLKTIRELSRAGIPCAVRMDPIIPGLNEREIRQILKCSARAGALHVTASTFKPRPDSWKRFSLLFPELSEKLRRLYFEKGERHRNAWYLPAELRREILQKVRLACDENGVTFASCREGMDWMRSRPSCDGSHLLGWRAI